MGAETLPILRALRAPRPLSARLIVGTLDDAPVAVLTCGIGPQKAARRTAAALPLADIHAVVSIGTCGALIDELDIGDVLTASTLRREAAGVGPAPLPWPGVPHTAVVTVTTPVWDAGRRAALAAQGGGVCEMEAAAIQAIVGDRPFSALKVVSDQAGGHADDPPSWPGPVEIARFQVRALELCGRLLLPALRAGLR
jgi:nucleoside phosphorylase